MRVDRYVPEPMAARMARAADSDNDFMVILGILGYRCSQSWVRG